MKKDFPEIEDFCRLHDADLLLSNDERNIRVKKKKDILPILLFCTCLMYSL